MKNNPSKMHNRMALNDNQRHLAAERDAQWQKVSELTNFGFA